MFLKTHGIGIQLVSDLHLDHWRSQGRRPHLPIEPRADLLIIAGDICNGLPQDDDLVWLQAISDLPDWPGGILMVLGNHDYYGLDLARAGSAWKRALSGTRIRVLDRDVVTVKGVRIAGCTLWTDFDRCDPLLMFDAERLNDYRHILSGGNLARPDDILASHYRDLNWLIDMEAGSPEDGLIVVTHHAPTWRSVHPDRKTDPINGAYMSALEWVMAELTPALWLHGHVHARLDYRMLQTRVACNPLGYCGEKVPHVQDDADITEGAAAIPA
jgi:predicted phosphohydrolase